MHSVCWALLGAGLLLAGCVQHAPHAPPPPSSEHMTGIDFYCFTDSESKYTVQGVNRNDPAFGTKRTSIETQSSEPATSAHWAPRARVRVASVSAPSQASTRAIRNAIRPLRVGLRACHETSPKFDRMSRYGLAVRLRWGRDQDVAVAITDRRGPGIAADVWRCMNSVLATADWPQLAPGTDVGLSLHLSAQ